MLISYIAPENQVMSVIIASDSMVLGPRIITPLFKLQENELNLNDGRLINYKPKHFKYKLKVVQASVNMEEVMDWIEEHLIDNWYITSDITEKTKSDELIFHKLIFYFKNKTDAGHFGLRWL